MVYYKHAFPDYDGELKFPPGFLGSGWVDSSWKNDTCPKITLDLDGDHYLTIFQDYANEDLRETGGPRYMVLGPQGGFIQEEPDVLLTTDSWEDVLELNLAERYAFWCY